ncbi:MAG: glutaredoxin 3 [Gammaproteobacteria bacterium]|nr:glutaredoxin 3 [Gammaproteobacteria bacterium]
MNVDVVIYSSDYCGYCHRAKQLLNSKGVKYIELAVDADQNLRKEMVRKSGQQTVPQIWIGKKHIGGCDELHHLERLGTLNNLLNIMG